MADELTSIEVPAVWVGAEETVVLQGEEFIVQYQGGTFYLTVGQPTPPVLVGSPEQIAEQAKQIEYVPIKVVARYSISPEKYRELVQALGQSLASYDEAQKKA